MFSKLAGIQVFLLLARFSMFTAWGTYLGSKFGSKREFVSLDAKQYANEPRNYELQSPIKSPQSALMSPGAEFDPYRRSLTGTPDYLSKETQREYRSPTLSFSTPRAPSRGGYDLRSMHGRGGLGLHPPMDEDELKGPGVNMPTRI